MKIIDWFKGMLSKIGKKKYMLNESNIQSKVKTSNTNFVPRVEVNNTKSREDIIRSLRKDMIVKDLSEEYNYTKFSPENIREKYDMESILSAEDMTALSCLYGAIKDGNNSEFKGFNEDINNNINKFLEENPNNIVTLINLMIKDAKKMYDSLGDDRLENTTVQGLIPGSYGDISQLIEEYNNEKELLDR